jgi:flavin reductase (DIM6/NTAB) family NADH-FMN oxidoreductase RutF
VHDGVPDRAEDAAPAAVSQVGSGELKSVMSEFASGVTVVTAEWQGRSHAMTATAFCSVSLDPPLVLVCVGKGSRFHPAVTSAGSWAVSLLSADQGWVARHFSSSTRDLPTQFTAVPHTRAARSGAPLVTGSRGWLDCSTYALHDAGDHTIVVGLVVQAGAASTAGHPLTYHRAAYSDSLTD